MDIQKLGGMYGNSAAITGGTAASEAAQLQGEIGKFQALLDSMKANSEQPNMQGTVASSQIAQSGRLNGEYTSGFDGSFTSEADKAALPTGAAANSSKIVPNKTIDRTSDLYEKSLELESYFVKMMLSSMRSISFSTYMTAAATSYSPNLLNNFPSVCLSSSENPCFSTK